MDTLCFLHWIIKSAKSGFAITLEMFCGNYITKCNISTLITKYIHAILQRRIGSNQNYLLEVTGKVW
jgi:hypothetical protein